MRGGFTASSLYISSSTHLLMHTFRGTVLIYSGLLGWQFFGVVTQYLHILCTFSLDPRVDSPLPIWVIGHPLYPSLTWRWSCIRVQLLVGIVLHLTTAMAQ